jgi:lactoylglutathione lyase
MKRGIARWIDRPRCILDRTAARRLKKRSAKAVLGSVLVHLYEAHLPVANTEQSKAFYVEVAGLEFAHRDVSRDIVFLWAGGDRRSMLGLWGPATVRGGDFHLCHVAFAVSLPELHAAIQSLTDAGVRTQNFAGEETTEPSVIGWMPSAQIYFRDPDGHSLEFIALLEQTPDPNFNGSLSEWQKQTGA